MDPLLSLRGVSKSYWRGLREVEVLKGVSLDIHAGEMVAVWGQGRSGKTTLLKLAAGLEEPDAGVVVVSGRDLRDLSGAQFARVLGEEIGWAKPTGPYSRDMRMLEYLAMPLFRKYGHRKALRLAAGALEKVGVSDCANQRWGDLADSEQALIAIAHAIVREPRVLLVDETTKSLDDLEREEVMELLRSLAEQQKMGVLVTVPDMAEMMRAHRFHSLSSGRLLAPPDPPEEGGELRLLASPDPLEEGGELIDLPGVDVWREGAGGASA